MKQVTLYTTTMCAYCVGAKTLLERRGIPFEEINLARDPDSRAELTKITGMYTFPQIVIGGEPLGGFHELRAADKAGTLTELVAA